MSWVRATHCFEPGQGRKTAAIRSLGRASVPSLDTYAPCVASVPCAQGFLLCSYCGTPVGFTVQDIVKEETADIHVSKVDLHRRLYHSLCRPRRSARSQLFQVQTRYPFLDAVFTRILVEYWPSSQVPVQAIFSRLVPLFPRPELEEVQKGTTVFPVKSLFLMKLFTTHEASYHQIG